MVTAACIQSQSYHYNGSAACSSLIPPEDLVYRFCFCSILMLSTTQCSSTMIYSATWGQRLVKQRIEAVAVKYETVKKLDLCWESWGREDRKRWGIQSWGPDLRTWTCAIRGWGRQWIWFWDLCSKKHVAEQLWQHEHRFISWKKGCVVGLMGVAGISLKKRLGWSYDSRTAETNNFSTIISVPTSISCLGHTLSKAILAIFLHLGSTAISSRLLENNYNNPSLTKISYKPGFERSNFNRPGPE